MRFTVRSLATIVALATLALAARPASAQLDVTIDPTQGFPGDSVNAQVDPGTVAANCTTTVPGLSATFTDLFAGPFADGSLEGELAQRFFPDPDDIVYESYGQLSYLFTMLYVGAVAQNLLNATVTELPHTFVLTFADAVLSQQIGAITLFDAETGSGSLTVPDEPAGPYSVVALCITPSFDLDYLEQGVIQGGQYLQSIGAVFGPAGPVSPEFTEFAQEYLDTTATGLDLLAEFVLAVGPNLVQPLMIPQALGVQPYEILAPGPINIRTANVWRTRTKPGRVHVNGTLQTGQLGPDDKIEPTDFTIRVTDGLDLDVAVDVTGASCTLKKNGAVICQNGAKTYRVRFMPVKKNPGQYKFDIKLFGLDVSAPQEGPVTLELDNGIPRAGSAASCRTNNAKLTCKG